MTRQDWIWVAIRIFGIYALVYAVCAIPEVISSSGNYYAYSATRTYRMAESGMVEAFDKRMQTTALFSLLGSIAKVVIASIFSYYLLRRGNFLFRVMCRINPPKPDAPAPTKADGDGK